MRERSSHPPVDQRSLSLPPTKDVPSMSLAWVSKPPSSTPSMGLSQDIRSSGTARTAEVDHIGQQ